KPAFGSHNVRSLSHAMAAAQLMGLPERSYEIQMLYGMADPIKDALVQLGQRVRVYTPYGQLLPGMAYLVRRLLENTANTSFLRASFAEHVSEEKLLMNPSHNHSSFSARAEPSAAASHGYKNEPVADFSNDPARQQMQDALAAVKRQLGQSYPLFIYGQKVTTTATIDSINPSHVREVVGKCGKATTQDAERAIN